MMQYFLIGFIAIMIIAFLNGFLGNGGARRMYRAWKRYHAITGKLV